MLLLLALTAVATTFAREHQPRYSVFGPPQPAVWEFQLATGKEPAGVINGFNFYRKNQRQKTHFFSINVVGEDAGQVSKNVQFAGGIVLFPYRNDDRFQVEVGAIEHRLGTGPTESSYFSRVTFRPATGLWLRGGSEALRRAGPIDENDGRRAEEAVQYIALKIAKASWEATGAAGRTDGGADEPGLSGGALLKKLPGTLFVFGGLLQTGESTETVRTLVLGRWAPFRPDGLPAFIYIWKHRRHYDFHLAGLFYGRSNLFVRPAALGMTQGIFLSNLGLRANSNLRRRQLMAITDENRNADLSIFFVALDQQLELLPGQLTNVGFKTLMVFKLFTDSRIKGLSTPTVDLILTEETTPAFDPVKASFANQSEHL